MGRLMIGKPNQNIMLLLFLEMTGAAAFWNCISGMLMIMPVKANRLYTLKMPIMQYSWKTALTRNVKN